MKKLIINTILFALIATILFSLYPEFDCRFQTRDYFKQTTELKQKINDRFCYDNPSMTQQYFDENCRDLINEHNSIIEKWASLSCVDIDIKSLEIED